MPAARAHRTTGSRSTAAGSADLRDAESAAREALHAQPLARLSEDAERLDPIDSNPVSKIALPAVAKANTKVWAPSQVDVFLEATSTHRLGAMFELEVLTGMRRGELCGLRWSDVDLVERELVVRVGSSSRTPARRWSRAR